MVQQEIQRAVDAWVECGRDREAIKDGHTYVLRFGRRFKLQHATALAVFVFFFLLGLFAVQRGDATMKTLACLVLFGLLTISSIIYVTYVFSSRVIIDDTRVTVRCFGMAISECTRETLSTAYKSPIHKSVVLQRHDGKKTRVSTQLDGLRSLVAWLWLRPRNTLTDSIVAWMKTEAPDMDEPSDGR